MEEEHRRFFVLARIAFVVAFAAHALFLVLFLLVGEFSLALFNVVSVAVWGGCLYAHSRGWYQKLGGPALAEIFAHGILCTVVLGTSSGFHFYVLTAVALPFLVPFYSRRLKWGLAGLAGLIFTGLSTYGQMVPPVSRQPDWVLAAFLAGNSLGLVVVIAAVLATYESAVVRAETALQAAYARTDELLRNILPSSIVDRLKQESTTVAQRHDQVSVLFADLVGFTELASRVPPERVVELLNRIFSSFDRIVEDRPVEKIKTIGDAYMVVAGAPEPYPDHAMAVVDLALELREFMRRISREEGLALELRMGAHSGEAVAGVIGTQTLAYDLWGDTVNTASRMETCGVSGAIQITEATKRVLEDRYHLEPRGTVAVPGKGPMPTWLVTARADSGDVA